ncbi:MAG: MBL fold metallo-hydrolase [Cyclobacteriaceae bacterium]
MRSFTDKVNVMDVRVKFLGGAKSVTGSKYLLEIDDKKILVDCGMFQGKKELRLRNWNELPIDPSTIDLVVITHAHIDHTGYLPRLVKDGFGGKIICTRATEDLMKILLLDAGKLQEEEAQFAYKKGYSKHSKPQPLFGTEDAKKVLEMVESHPLEREIVLTEGVSTQFYNAGHILGAAIVEISLQGKTQNKKIVFSGDLGRNSDPLMYAPTVIKNADILFIESTYGDRINPIDEVENDLAEAINYTYNKGGCVIIPAFAVGRTQNLLLYLNKLISANKIPSLPIFIDSPMAITVTHLYEKHSSINKLNVQNNNGTLISVFDSANIHFCNSAESSRELNNRKEPGIIISASGMCTGGRILHHLYHRLPNKNDTILFAGYQAEGTRGRDILDGAESVRIFGIEVPVKCSVKEVNGLSAHADQEELMQWISNFESSPKMTFIIHGEIKAAEVLQAKIKSSYHWNCTVPEYLESFELFSSI